MTDRRHSTETILREHARYLGDAPRVDAFARALNAVVRPGDVVLDLGCGTGILGFLACRAGAARVYAVDDSGLIEAAREAARVNGFADRIVYIRSHSTEIELPERADVVVCDEIGPLGFEARVIAYFEDARKRLLKEDARLVPSRIGLWGAPLHDEAVYGAVDQWLAPRAGFDFSCLRTHAVNTRHLVTVEGSSLLAPPRALMEFDLRRDVRPFDRGTGEWAIAEDGVFHGLLCWFVAALAPGVTLTNAPGAPDRMQRPQGFLPVERPVRVRAGDRVVVDVRVRHAERLLAWAIRIERDAALVAAFTHSRLQGLLLSREDLSPAAQVLGPGE